LKYCLILFLLCASPFIRGSESSGAWGFYGHRLINRMAVFTLPSSMIGMYKYRIDYISDHAVDPDKRRYATRHEAVRHYIDLDQWGELPFDNVPRKWTDLLAAYTQLDCITHKGDTVRLHAPLAEDPREGDVNKQMKTFVIRHVIPTYYEDQWIFDQDTVQKYFPNYDCAPCLKILGQEHFSEHGILPFHLNWMQQRLTDAFARKDLPTVLRLSADFGHYIGDAHVPLHTTKNYNGQLSDQNGIHAFWESRIPELFAERDWDFMVGQARYIEDPVSYFWNIVLESHALVSDVLSIEKDLSITFPESEQYCFEERLSTVVRTQCADYARAYQDRMQGMVEARMQDAILAVGSAWFTAWVDGGQPELADFINEMSDADKKAFEELERAFIKGKAFGREHD
jgi:hypothetical protein